jgi:hypothetical protein
MKPFNLVAIVLAKILLDVQMNDTDMDYSVISMGATPWWDVVKAKTRRLSRCIDTPY